MWYNCRVPKIVSIIYVYYNTPNELTTSLNSIKKAAGKYSYEVIIVDNTSPKKLPTNLLKDKTLKVIHSTKNVGFGKAANLAAKKAKGQYLLIVNPDVIFHKNSIQRLIEEAKAEENLGALAPQQLGTRGNILQSIGGTPFLPDALFVFSFLNKLLPQNKYSKRYWRPELDRTKKQEVETLGGACILFPRKVFLKLKGFDTRFFMYFEEADICHRIRKLNLKLIYLPTAKVTHLVGRSTQDKKFIQKTFEESRYKFLQKYHGTILAAFSEFFLRLSSRVVQKKMLQ